MTPNPLTLFVSWRSPSTRTIHPVGRIAYYPDRGLYEFAYIRAFEMARRQGFLPFLEFPDPSRVYLSGKPFPLLANRLMPPSRPEYRGFLASLGLPESAHPMHILARTGGERKTDQIELFPAPAPDTTGCYSTHCLVRAVRYMPQPGTEERIAKLATDEKLFIMWDVQNPVDPQAVTVRTEDYHTVGFLPAYLTGDVWRLKEGCGSFAVYVDRVNPPPAEVHHRLLVRVSACWPPDFRPFADDKYQPLVTHGHSLVAT